MAREADSILEGIRRDYAPAPAEGVVRVLFLGTSQTWGSGAAVEAETFVRVIERRLNATVEGQRIECLNAGVSGAYSPRLAAMYVGSLLELEPDVVVVNLSNNDLKPEAFATALETIARAGAERGVDTLFCLEANSVEHRPGELPMHATMRRVAEELDVPLIDLHAYLGERSDTGFLWWDLVHPTSYGHHLIAARLVPELARAAEAIGSR